MTHYDIHVDYNKNGVQKTAKKSDENITLVTDYTDNRITVKLTSNGAITINKVYLEKNFVFSTNDKFFANGFQSWTDTKEFSKNEKMPGIGFVGSIPVGKKMGLHYVGDYTFTNAYRTKKGVFHSNSYTYIRKGNIYNLIGSMSDRNGYTIIEADMNNDLIRIYKELEGVTIDGEYTIFDLYTKTGGYDEVFDAYFAAMNIKPLTDKKIKGYTSWYNYYQNINEEVILRDLEALCGKADGLFDTFQIDDGYQVAVGEWLNVDKKKFPNGMKVIADGIHAKGLQAGIWLAPFGVQHNSQMVQQHPDWLIKNEKGKPICVGGNWGGFYALDIYNQEVRDYIKKFFDVILNEWGYDLVKLDFLYAAAILPRNNKSRGEVMYDAMDLLRECVGEKKILGCGVQMMPCFGKVEYMRIGADMSLEWKHNFGRHFMHREDVSTINALNNSIYRRHLNERAFLCDPDVFLVRDYNVKFTFEQRKILAKFIKIFGGVIFTSDDVNRYNDAQFECLKDTFSADGAELKGVDVVDNICTVDYAENGVNKKLVFNIATGETK